MASIFDDMALVGKLTDAAPDIVKQVQVIQADAQKLVNDIDKIILPNIRHILGHVAVIVESLDAIFQQPTAPAK
jgi:hypothetical protein